MNFIQIAAFRSYIIIIFAKRSVMLAGSANIGWME